MISDKSKFWKNIKKCNPFTSIYKRLKPHSMQVERRCSQGMDSAILHPLHGLDQSRSKNKSRCPFSTNHRSNLLQVDLISTLQISPDRILSFMLYHTASTSVQSPGRVSRATALVGWNHDSRFSCCSTTRALAARALLCRSSSFNQ